MEISVEIGPACGEVVSGGRPNPLHFSNFHTAQTARILYVLGLSCPKGMSIMTQRLNTRTVGV